jgi:hypothetical protein
LSIIGLDKENGFSWFSQPNKDERKMILTINNYNFYSLTDKEFQERHYLCHLICASYNNQELPIFTIKDEGKLSISESRYYYCWSSTRIQSVNPFSDEGLAHIITASKKGIETDSLFKIEGYRNLYQDCIPELACLLDEIIPPETEYDAESA